VRISLVEREAEEKRKRRRRKKRKVTRSFDTAIAQPQVQARRQSRKDRAPAKRGNPPRPRAAGIPSESRPRTENPAATPVTVRSGSRRRIVLVRLSAFLVLAGLVGLVVYGSTDAKFFIYQASVVGAHHIDATTIYRQAEVDEQSIFWIRPEKVAERILQIDGIKAARVRCALPAQVSIEVEEREPVVMWRALVQQRDWWLDEEGRVLPYPGDVESPEMIFVVDSSERQLEPGGYLQPAELVRSAQQLAAALPGIRIFFYDSDRELSFTQQVDGEQWPVYLGTSDDLPRKIQVLQVLTRHLQENKIRPRYVDVRWADYPAYSVPGGAAASKGE
jgi:cell division septal protein FtsQ